MRLWALIHLATAVVAIGCGHEPERPGPLPETGARPPRPASSVFVTSEARLLAEDGTSLKSMPARASFRVDVDLELAQGSPRPDMVRAAIGMINRRGKFAIGGTGIAALKWDKDGKAKASITIAAPPVPGKWLVRVQVPKEREFAEHSLEVTPLSEGDPLELRRR